jgi:hypothetical protein
MPFDRAAPALRASFRATPLAAAASRLSLPYSSRRTLAVRNTPCSRASSAADAHRESGICKRRCATRRKRTPAAAVALPFGITFDITAMP